MTDDTTDRTQMLETLAWQAVIAAARILMDAEVIFGLTYDESVRLTRMVGATWFEYVNTVEQTRGKQQTGSD